MAKLNKLSKLVATARKNSVAEDFISELNFCIEQENKRDYTPSASFKPSGISGCKRSLYYELTGVRPDVEAASPELTGICESGSDRHETIQEYVMIMNEYGIECEWLDVGKFVKDNNIPYVQVLSNKGNETKLFSEKYNMRFLCDGLIKYKGEYYILEIKTESTNKFNRHDEPWPEHILQATCYSMVLQVKKVLFVYENRDVCTKKGFTVNVNDKMIENVENIINTVNDYMEKDLVPPRECDKCKYCKYKGACNRDGE